MPLERCWQRGSPVCAGIQHAVPAVTRGLLKAPLELELHHSGSQRAGPVPQVLTHHCLLARALEASQGWAVALGLAAFGQRFAQPVLPARLMLLHCDLQAVGC